MAQSGYTPISLYYSSTTTNVPLAANLANGELAINITDGKLFYKDNSGTVQIIATKAGATGTVSSVAMTVPSFLSVSGSPVTSSGTLAVTLSGTALPVANGGTGQTTFTSGQVLYGNGTSGISTSANFTFNGTTVTMANDASISGLTVGKGGGAVSTNTAFGLSALQGSNTGNGFNVAVGYQVLFSNTSGQSNIGIGGNISGVTGAPLISNTTGSYNIGIGCSSLVSNTTGANNTSVGTQALQANTTASNNTAVGYQAGYSNTTGYSCSFFGQGAGYSNNANNQTFVGVNAGYSTTSGFNTFVGAGAGYYVTSGAYNTVIGQYNGNQGGLDIRTASNYIVLSDGAGNPRGIFDNSGNFLVGQTATINTEKVGITAAGNALLVKNTAIGGTARLVYQNGNGTIDYFYNYATSATIGTITNTATTVAYNTSSDYRLKENVAPMQNALNVVQQLKPVTYKWKADGSDGQGFIAHELQAVVPDCVTGEKDAVDSEGKPVYQGIDTSFLVATLTAAIQELSAELNALKAKVGA